MPNLAFALLSLPGKKIVERHAWMDATWTAISLCPAWLCYLLFLAFLLSALLCRSVAAAAWFAALLVGFWVIGLELPTGWLLIVSGLWWAFRVFRKTEGESGPTARARVQARGATAMALLLLAVATAAGFPGYESIGSGQATACLSNMKNISTAVELYQTDFHDSYPATLGALTPNYLKTLPLCPTENGQTCPYTVELLQNGHRVVCRSPRHHDHAEWKVEPYVVGSGAATSRTLDP